MADDRSDWRFLWLELACICSIVLVWTNTDAILTTRLLHYSQDAKDSEIMWALILSAVYALPMIVLPSIRRSDALSFWRELVLIVVALLFFALAACWMWGAFSNLSGFQRDWFRSLPIAKIDAAASLVNLVAAGYCFKLLRPTVKR